MEHAPPGRLGPDKEGGLSSNLSLIVLYAVGFIAIFYFMAIRPQQKSRRAHEALVSSIKRGDKVITAGGIYGTVKRTDEGSVMLEIAKGVEIKIARRAVAEVLSGGPVEKPGKAEKETAEIEAPVEPPAEVTDKGDKEPEA